MYKRQFQFNALNNNNNITRNEKVLFLIVIVYVTRYINSFIMCMTYFRYAIRFYSLDFYVKIRETIEHIWLILLNTSFDFTLYILVVVPGLKIKLKSCMCKIQFNFK